MRIMSPLFAASSDRSSAAAASANKSEPTPAPAPVVAAPAVSTSSPSPAPMRVKFMQPSYPGKDITKSRNLADAIITGAFPGFRLGLNGVTLALIAASGELVVYMPKAGPFSNSPRAVQPEMIPAPAGIETPDGLVLAPGARGAAERFAQAIRDAWVAANASGQTAWGAEYPLGDGK